MKIFYIFSFIITFFLNLFINGITYANDKLHEENVIERDYETFKSDKIYLEKLHNEYVTLSIELMNVSDTLESMNYTKEDLNRLSAIVSNMKTLSKDLFSDFKPSIKNIDLKRYVTELEKGLNTKIHVLNGVLTHFKKHDDTMLFESKNLIINDSIKLINKANEDIIEANSKINNFIVEKDNFFNSNNFNELKRDKEKGKKRYLVE